MIKAAQKPRVQPKNPLEIARRVLDIEAEAVRGLVERLDERFTRAVELIDAREGRVVVSGMGKSGHIARKIASTLASTGAGGAGAVFLAGMRFFAQALRASAHTKSRLTRERDIRDRL